MNVSIPKAPEKRKLIILAIVVALLVALFMLLNKYVTLEDLVEQEARIRTAIASHPFQSFVIGFLIYTVVALVPGTGGKAIVYGWLFGFWQAVLIVSVGLTIAAMVIFSLSRYLIRDAIEHRYTHFLSVMNSHIEKEGAFYLLTLRVLHVPFSIVNPVSGASRVTTFTFFWTTVVGLLPSNAIWAFVGVRLPTLEELVRHGPATFLDLPLLVILGLSFLLPFPIRWAVNRFGTPGAADEIEIATNHDLQGNDT